MYDDEGIETKTSKEAFLFDAQIENKPSALLERRMHINYLLKQVCKLQNISFSGMVPWLSSWFANAFFVLLGKEKFCHELENGMLTKLQDIGDQIVSLQTTGICGGEGLLPNLGSTYAGLVFLKAIGRMEEIDKKKVVMFIESMKTETGFRMHEDGEVDLRSLYCALASYSLLFSSSLTENTQMNPLSLPEGASLFSCAEDLIQKAQTYEGAFGSAPGEEAHGGYTYCALASLKILEKPVPNQALLQEWLTDRQNRFSKGFNGRTNKLVDACYNFWVGACFKMLGHTKYFPEDLITYTLSNCQAKEGGLKSSMQASPDVYHTAYALLGLYILEGTEFNYVLGVPLTQM
ncbi:protein farnesyltransferase subunit beta [Nematocida sp. AWRm77]|nr:protein farnesyltransferase subunit beta [Nematocida sp. AWRm77]